jgi:predicted TIM-barrel fold metal-dependent hydrolase
MSETGGVRMTGVGTDGTIDCDVHLVVPSVETLMPYLTDHWRAYIRETAFKGPVDTAYPRGAAIGGNVPGATRGEPSAPLERVQAAVFADGGTELAILTCAYAVESVRNPFAAAALAGAVNDWQSEHWLDPEPRLRGSIVVPSQDPQLAAAEIERVAGRAGFVQVFLPVHSEALYGTRRYYPIYEAALRHDLAIGIHFGGSPGNPPTPVGWPSYYVEEYVGMATLFQSQLIGLVTEGAFDRFPALRVVLSESGVSWLPSLLWRLDKEWKGLRREVPWVRRLPSEYVREHVRLTTAPLDVPPDPGRVAELIDQLGGDDLLLYASDFPHRHDERDPAAFLLDLPVATARKIRRENAAACYRLNSER